MEEVEEEEEKNNKMLMSQQEKRKSKVASSVTHTVIQLKYVSFQGKCLVLSSFKTINNKLN